jgi:NADPH-dependent 2,4-dienoyl-CoA reductase/sulfur reductase-like enzyme/rhodanese-related sulfurtransferase
MTMAEARHSVVVIGASAAGLRCACRLARLRSDWHIRVVEARPVFSIAACGLPYVISGDVGDLGALGRTQYGVERDVSYFTRYKGVDVLAGHRATSLDVDRHVVRVEGPNGAFDMRWDNLVLACGASPRRLACQPTHPRVGVLHIPDDVKALKQPLARGELDRVALVGAGLVGCELAEALRGMWGIEVVMLEAAGTPLPQILDPDVGACVASHLRENGVDLRLNSHVSCIEANDDQVTLTAGAEIVKARFAVIAVGVEPVVDLALEAGIVLGPSGAIAVDERLATSVPHVWAVGDCSEVRHAVTGEPVYLPLGSLANRQGRSLANILAGRPESFPPVVGAVAVKVFDCNVAATGCTETVAGSSGLDARAVWVSIPDRAHYWPEARELHIKLVYEAVSSRVLGVQAFGAGEVVKRVDVATQLIARGATLEEFSQLEHAYAPPYAPALEPLAVAAMVALNQEDGVEAASPYEAFEDQAVLDVRQPAEVKMRPASFDNCAALPLGELAGRLDEVDVATTLVACSRGTRSAEAVRMLLGRGIHARYLGGGLHWRAASGARCGDAARVRHVELPEKE